MRIIISPAKQMRVDTDTFTCTEVPVFMEKTEILKNWISGLSYEEQKALWASNDKIAKQNAERFADMDLHRNLTPALLAYDGIQYTYMASRHSRVLINLASKEYSKCIEKYLQPGDRYITCVFGEVHAGKVVQKGVYAKMARGEMVRFMAGIRTEEPEQIKTFNWSGYQFDESRSSDTEYVFIRKEIPGKR